MPDKAHPYNDRYRLLKQSQIEHVTEQELSIPLREKINESFEHIYETDSHISQEEREKWNKMDDLKAVQKQGLLFTAEEKKKLDSIVENANYYIHPKYNSMDETKTYIELTVNKDGHVVFANNPSRLEVDANESLLLNGNSTDFYLKISDPVLDQSPTVKTANNNTNKYAQVNVQYMKNNCITSSYYNSNSLEVVKNKIRIDSYSNMWYYNDTRGWCQLNKSSEIELENGKIKESYFKTKMTPYPIGVIIPAPTVSNSILLKLEDLGFIQLNGELLNRSDYPELWQYINNKDNGCYLVSEEDWQNYYLYYQSCGFFSTGDGETTFRLPLFFNVEPRHYKTTDDSIALGAVYNDAYPSEDANGFTPNNMQNYKKSAFYYPILNYNVSAFYDSSNADDKQFNFVTNVTSVFEDYKSDFKGIFKPGFPTGDTIFSLYGNPYMSKPHSNTLIDVMRSIPTGKINEDGDPVYTTELYTQENQSDEPLKLLVENKSDAKINNMLYRQTTDKIHPYKISIKRKMLKDMNAAVDLYFIKDSTDQTAQTQYTGYITKLNTPGNKYYGKYIYTIKDKDQTNTSLRIYDFETINDNYFSTNLSGSSFLQAGINNNIYKVDSKTKFEQFISSGEKFLLKLNNETALSNILSIHSGTSGSEPILFLTFVCVEMDGLNLVYHDMIQPALYLSDSARIDLMNKINNNFNDSIQGIIFHIKDKHNFVIDGITTLNSTAVVSPSKYGFTISKDIDFVEESSIDEIGFEYIERTELSEEPPKLPQVIKFNNGATGNEFNYNYLKMRYYIKAK